MLRKLTGQILRVAAAGFDGAFLPPAEKSAYRTAFRAQAAVLGLL